MDKFVSMEVFVAVVEAGSLTAAAERFDLSSAMVGKHIRSLETQLSTRLLTRTTRRQSLTEIGRQYYEQCRRILADVKAAESLAEAMTSAPRGTLKVTVPLTYGVEVFSPAMTDYLNQYPEVSLELDLSNRVFDLVEEGFDAAVRIGRLPDSSLVARPLKPYRMRACASPAYLQRMGTPKTPADLLHHECLGFLHWGREGLWRLDGDAESDYQLRPGRFRANNGQALKMAALRGFGLVLQPEALLANEIGQGTLVSVLEDYLPDGAPVHLIYPRDRQPTPKLTSFIDFVIERFGA
ncbi:MULTISPECIES: LysR family transcriptional regulator [Paraburkholderia]|uniref:LysR family transcriptional regulator n=1 Tax=Paraburkholderia caribensis TaxID=75105 RepID=A0A9Q6RYF6_9BURK|nr:MULTISPECIES: LysR family transcriptional regulator [Paraburkholderia]ALP63127.1 LysR family transcriptional regulator [Paraburkholderia caribensis]AUT51636.1 LysR family transcriptional regulator [Paraburkholderia caribensis]MCO4877881.1 LysR family transcriptional regulator [Paraburkholderia caribensis]MDR6383343.1 DNA-binding transcriptional LysR family regulator [Paraburkholderia caribensis]PTB30195.1 LysR family transcriptional regulator [Paraburkholderia caribensis]